MSAPPVGCPAEGVLLGHLDGELDEPAGRTVEAHLSSCGECEELVRRLRERDRRVRAWIRDHDPEPPGREAYDLGDGPSSGAGDAARPAGRGSGRTRRWAAAAAVVIALGTLVGPARGVVLDPVLGWLSDLAGAPAEAPPAAGGPIADAAHGSAAAATSFRWGGPELALEFQSPATEGTLTVEATGDSLVTLRGPARPASLDVRPGLVLVDNSTVPGGDYILSVPATLERVRIKRGGLPETVLDVGRLARPLTLSLADPSPSRGGSP